MRTHTDAQVIAAAIVWRSSQLAGKRPAKRTRCCKRVSRTQSFIKMAERELNRRAKKVNDPHERANDRLMKLFNDASSGELSCGSENSETSSNEEPLQSSESEESDHDPFSDCDGEYGPDKTYEPNEDSGSTTHVSDSEEETGKKKSIRYQVKPECQPVVESPITLKDLGVHVHVSAYVESPGDLDKIMSPLLSNALEPAQQKIGDHLTTCESTDTSPPRSVESSTLLQDMDWLNDVTESSIETQNNPEAVQNTSSLSVPQIPGLEITDNYYQHQHSTILSVLEESGAQHQRPTSPVISDEEWQTNTVPIPEFEFNINSVGPQFVIHSNSSAIEIFHHFFPESIMMQIVERTNSYGAALCKANRPSTRGSRQKSFKPTTVEELKRFLGLCMLQSQIETPNIRKLFTFSDPLYYHPIFTYSISGRRFEQLLRCLCVYEGNAKGIDKILEFANEMIAKFQELYKPHRQLALDESMLLFRGRLSFRQYIKSKKAKYGVKFYILTTSDGYILNFKIYQGKNNTAHDIDSISQIKSKTEKLVMNLMQPYLFKGHELYMDNFYNSVTLSKKLLNCKTHTTGTLRKDRKDNPKNVVNKALKKDEHVWARKGKVYVSAWKDKRNVTMITTQHHPKLVVTRNRYGKLSKKPKEVVEYNKYMSGIDLSDQMLSYYSTPKKTVRWYKKVFFHIFDMALWNSYYVFRKHCNDKETMLGFRERIIRSYLKCENLTCADIISSKKMTDPRKSSCSTNNRIPNNHWPELIPKPENCKRNKVFLKCRLCTKNKIKKETSYRCKGCVSKPPLCPGCFEQWHLALEEDKPTE